MLVSYGLLHHRMFVFDKSFDKIFAELQFILVMYFKEQFAETEKTESASCLFSFFFQNHKVFLLL